MTIINIIIISETVAKKGDPGKTWNPSYSPCSPSHSSRSNRRLSKFSALSSFLHLASLPHKRIFTSSTSIHSLLMATLPPQLRVHGPVSVTPQFTPAPWHRAGKITLAPSWQQNLLREQNKMKGSFFRTVWGLLGENKRLGETRNWGRTWVPNSHNIYIYFPIKPKLYANATDWLLYALERQLKILLYKYISYTAPPRCKIWGWNCKILHKCQWNS